MASSKRCCITLLIISAPYLVTVQSFGIFTTYRCKCSLSKWMTPIMIVALIARNLESCTDTPWITTGFYIEQYLSCSYLTCPLRWNQVLTLKEKRVWGRYIQYAPAQKVPVHKIQCCLTICVADFVNSRFLARSQVLQNRCISSRLNRHIHKFHHFFISYHVFSASSFARWYESSCSKHF